MIKGSIEEIKITISIIKKEENKEKEMLEEIKLKQEVENPSTGYKSIIYGIIVLIVLGILLAFISRKYKFFQKI